jgi:tetratricopeptide (TPR) repeat protein
LLLVAGGLTACVSSPRLPAVVERSGLPRSSELTATPFFSQTEHQCGPAALATVLGAAGRPAAPDELTREIYLPGREGSLQPEIAAAVRARGLLPYAPTPRLDALLAEVEVGRPVLVLQRQGLGPWPAWHYAVVVGYDADADEVILRSGTNPRRKLRADVFEATWSRATHWALVALAPGELPAQPEAGPERYLAAAATLEETGRIPEARASYEAAARQWPQSVLPGLGLANVAARTGNWTVAEAGYRAVLVRDPANAAALNNRGEALLRLGCPRAALAALEQGRARLADDEPLLRAIEGTATAAAAAAGAIPADPAHCEAFPVR